MEKIYDLFADYYGMLTADVDYDAWYGYLIKLGELNKENASEKKILDLGCGSGELLSRFYADGFDCRGVDNSCEMLSKCDETLFKLRKTSRKCTLIQQDMQRLKLNTKFDFVYSACDSVNYLNPGELKMLFRNVYGMLKDGCVFTFDVINPEKFASSEKITENGTTLDIVRRNEEDKLITDIEILRGGEARKINFTQYVLTKDMIFEVFAECGFGEIKFYDFFCCEETAELSEKIQVVIKK